MNGKIYKIYHFRSYLITYFNQSWEYFGHEFAFKVFPFPLRVEAHECVCVRTWLDFMAWPRHPMAKVKSTASRPGPDSRLLSATSNCILAVYSVGKLLHILPTRPDSHRCVCCNITTKKCSLWSLVGSSGGETKGLSANIAKGNTRRRGLLRASEHSMLVRNSK